MCTLTASVTRCAKRVEICGYDLCEALLAKLTPSMILIVIILYIMDGTPFALLAEKGKVKNPQRSAPRV